MMRKINMCKHLLIRVKVFETQMIEGVKTCQGGRKNKKNQNILGTFYAYMC